ncbi:MAG TPA: EamA family transporter [Oculatellaceae cyanobacterium]
MTRFYIVGFFVLMCFDTLAQMGFNAAASGATVFFPNSFESSAILTWITQLLVRQFIFLPIVGYLGAFVTWMTLLKHAPIGPAFAASHLHIVSVVLLSCLFLHEKLTWLQMCGCLFILGGIFVLAAETGGDQKIVIDDSDSYQKKSSISQA